MEIKDIKYLKEKILKCNLSTEDKLHLLKHLEGDNPDLDEFIKVFFKLCKIGKNFLELFDIDIGKII